MMKTRKRWNYGHWGNIGIADQSNETIRSYSCGYPIVVVTEEFKKMKLGCEKIIKQQKVEGWSHSCGYRRIQEPV